MSTAAPPRATYASRSAVQPKTLPPRTSDPDLFIANCICCMMPNAMLDVQRWRAPSSRLAHTRMLPPACGARTTTEAQGPQGGSRCRQRLLVAPRIVRGAGSAGRPGAPAPFARGATRRRSSGDRLVGVDAGPSTSQTQHRLRRRPALCEVRAGFVKSMDRCVPELPAPVLAPKQRSCFRTGGLRAHDRRNRDMNRTGAADVTFSLIMALEPRPDCSGASRGTVPEPPTTSDRARIHSSGAPRRRWCRPDPTPTPGPCGGRRVR